MLALQQGSYRACLPLPRRPSQQRVVGYDMLCMQDHAVSVFSSFPPTVTFMQQGDVEVVRKGQVKPIVISGERRFGRNITGA